MDIDLCNHFMALAAYNNAIWCDTVCRSHNIVGEFYETFWITGQQTPIYYPNLITLTSSTNFALNQNVLTELFTKKKDYAISVKDSFAILDLASFGFYQLFGGQWIFRQPPSDLSHQEMADLHWQRITSEGELLKWEDAWSQTDSSQYRLFRPSLLYDVDIGIMAIYKENQIIAGAIANRTTDVVGLSNVFTATQEVEKYWAELFSLIATYYPGLPIVGYRRDGNHMITFDAEFTLLGPLRVWVKK